MPFLHMAKNIHNFILNNYKVQEKVGNIKNNKKGTNFTLHKNNGTIDGCRKFTYYKKTWIFTGH